MTGVTITHAKQQTVHWVTVHHPSGITATAWAWSEREAEEAAWSELLTRFGVHKEYDDD